MSAELTAECLSSECCPDPILDYVIEPDADSCALIPVMTSYIAPSGVASASSEAAVLKEAWRAFDDTDYYWQSWATIPATLTYQFPTAKMAVRYSIRCRRVTDINDAPRDFTLDVSDDGVVWTTIDTQAGIDWLQNSETKSFTFINLASYLYYRISVTSVLSATMVAIRNFQLYDCE